MADKDYKVQVGVEAKADTRGLDQVNKGLDKVRKTARQVNEELSDDSAASNLEEVTDAAEETAEALDNTSDAAEGLQEAVSKVGQEARTTGGEMDKAGSKGEAAGRKMERGARKAAAGLGDLKAKVQATFNIPNELEAAYNRGVALGQAILDGWEKYIEGVDKAAVKRARELKDRLATEAAAREQAYTDALTSAKRERIYDEEQRKITAINDLYTQRIQLIGQLAVNRTAEVDHVEALRTKELELQRTIVKTREIRGEITKETAAALMSDLDASEARSAAKSREDRQQIMLEAAIQARDETARQIQLIKAEQEQASKLPYAGMTGDDYQILDTIVERGADPQEKQRRENIEKQFEAARHKYFTAKNNGDADDMQTAGKAITQYSNQLKFIEEQKQKENDALDKLLAIEQYLVNKGIISAQDNHNAKLEKIKRELDTQSTKDKTRANELKEKENQLQLDESNVTTQQQLLQYQKEINSKEAAIAAAKADQASAVAADERRQKDLAELASQRKKVQDRWREHYDQLTAGQDYKDRETPRLKRLLKEGQHMADAGYMSEQDSARLARMRDEALKGLPRELQAKVKWMVDDMIKGYSSAASGERNLLTPLERKDLEAGRFKGKLDSLADITPSLPKDGAASKIVEILKDVAKYGILNEATIRQLEALSMRINADDAAGQRVVSLVRDLVQGELGRILTTMSRPQPARPRRITPEGRDLDAEEEVRTRIRSGAQTPQPHPQPHPQPAPQPATGQGYNAMIGEFARQMFGQGETSGRILDVMQQFLAVARQSASQASQYDARLRKMEQEVATLQSRASFGR